MKKWYTLIFFSIGVLSGYAQQSTQFTQYYFNQYVLNPAVAGTEGFVDVKASYRNQWTGIDGAPRTYTLSINSPIRYTPQNVRADRIKPHHGVGGYIFHDATGPISWSGFYASYAYHLKLTTKLTVSLGISAGVKQFRVDDEQIEFVQNPNDNLVAGGITEIKPDAALGIWVYSNKVFFGASSLQIFDQDIDLAEAASTLGTGKLNRHYFLTAGFVAPLNQIWSVVPSAMFKSVAPVPNQFDVNMKFVYKQSHWLGVSYRSRDAMAAVLGLNINDYLDFAYSYDFSTFETRAFNTGSHEVMLRVRWYKKLKKVMCPDYFW